MKNLFGQKFVKSIGPTVFELEKPFLGAVQSPIIDEPLKCW